MQVLRRRRAAPLALAGWRAAAIWIGPLIGDLGYRLARHENWVLETYYPIRNGTLESDGVRYPSNLRYRVTYRLNIYALIFNAKKNPYVQRPKSPQTGKTAEYGLVTYTYLIATAMVVSSCAAFTNESDRSKRACWVTSRPRSSANPDTASLPWSAAANLLGMWRLHCQPPMSLRTSLFPRAV